MLALHEGSDYHSTGREAGEGGGADLKQQATKRQPLLRVDNIPSRLLIFVFEAANARQKLAK